MRWWRIGKRDADLARELQSDLELEEEEQRERGLSAEEARYAARRAFGNPTLIYEQTHATWSSAWIESLVSDMRYGFRGMRRDAGSTVFAILIVGLGIGGASTVFSVVNALLLRPLPFRDPGQLVWISNGENYSTQSEHYSDLRDQNQSFSDLAGWSSAYSSGNKELTGTGEPERLTSVPVTENFFALLGVEPAIGRSFTREESQGRYSAPPAMVLSNSFWRRRFASDPNVVGRKLTLNNQPVTVVGVLPASFDFASVFAPGTSIDIFIPWPLKDNRKPAGNAMAVVGRLKPGVTIGGAQAEFTVLAKQLESQHPDRNPIRPRLVPLEQHVSGQVRPALVGVDVRRRCGDVDCLRESFASANVANGGTTKRDGDTSGVRSWASSAAATGADREHNPLVLRCCTGPSSRRGWHARGWRISMPSTFRFWKVFESMGARLSSPCWRRSPRACSLAWRPRCRCRAYNLREGLQEAGRDSSGSSRHGWFRDGLVVSEFALACVLLVGAALLIQSFLRVLDVNLGFQPERAAALRIDPSFRDFESRATELIYRRCVAAHPVSPRHRSSRDNRCAAARRRPGLGKSRPKGRFTKRAITRRHLFAS